MRYKTYREATAGIGIRSKDHTTESFQDQRCVDNTSVPCLGLEESSKETHEEKSHKGLPEEFKDNEDKPRSWSGSKSELNAIDVGSPSTLRVSENSKVQEQANWVDPGDFSGSKKLEQKVNRGENSVDSSDKSEQVLLPSSGESDSNIYLRSDIFPPLRLETSHVNMNFSSEFANSDEYQSFRSSVSLRKLAVDSDASKFWKIYDAGPRSVKCPLVCLAPVSGTADIFYKQILSLTARGIRVIAAEGPVYWSVNDWCEGFKRLLDHLDIEKVHIFGASLGGFLAQKFAEYTFQYSRVISLILCNTFMDTSIFQYNDTAALFWLLPGPILKKLVIGNIRTEQITDLSQAQTIEFIIERVDTLGQQELASRLTLNCVNCHVDTFKLNKLKITIVDVFDEAALSNQAREDLYRHYTHAKLAHLKTGGNFPYICRPDEVNLHIMVHLRGFNDTRYSAQENSTQSIEAQGAPGNRNGSSIEERSTLSEPTVDEEANTSVGEEVMAS